jgi:hypothetical protein
VPQPRIRPISSFLPSRAAQLLFSTREPTGQLSSARAAQLPCSTAGWGHAVSPLPYRITRSSLIDRRRREILAAPPSFSTRAQKSAVLERLARGIRRGMVQLWRCLDCLPELNRTRRKTRILRFSLRKARSPPGDPTNHAGSSGSWPQTHRPRPGHKTTGALVASSSPPIEEHAENSPRKTVSTPRRLLGRN